MTYNDFIKKLRLFLADPNCDIWSDSELNSFIDKAIRQYSLDSGFFLQKFSFVPNKDGSYSFPEDFGSYLIGWNDKGLEITVSSSEKILQRFGGSIRRSGDVRMIYGDLTTSGKYMLYPVPRDNQHAEFADFTGVYGEVEDDSFGVSSDGWGITSELTGCDFVGDAVCLRIAGAEEIKDYMPIIYYAMYEAYNTDCDHADPEIARNALARYRMRMAAYNSVKRKLNGLLDSARYY